jgi:hypothetical protein
VSQHVFAAKGKYRQFTPITGKGAGRPFLLFSFPNRRRLHANGGTGGDGAIRTGANPPPNTTDYYTNGNRGADTIRGYAPSGQPGLHSGK